MRNLYSKLILAFFVLVIMVLFSTDSFIYDRYGCSDSQCFFMSGKALMNGLKPYAEFADSKGLLLWVIYGIGYLISPTSLIGVWLLSLIAVGLAFYYLYKIAYLYLEDVNKSVLSVVLTSLALFNPWFHNETRAETFCWPFTLMSVYYTLLYSQRKNLDNRKQLLIGFAIGISVAACLMIKFTIAAMALICPLIVFYIAVKRKAFLHFFLSFVAGFSLIVLPSLIYLLTVGCFMDFIHEYFFVTTLTSIDDSLLTCIIVYLLDWKCMIQCVRDPGSCMCIVYLIGAYALCRVSKVKNSWIPFLIAFWFLSISVYHSWWIYYLESFTVFSIFGFIFLIKKYNFINSIKYSSPIWSISVLLILSIVWRTDEGTYYVWQKDKLKDYLVVENLISQMEHPLIVNYCIEAGFGKTAESLPACKYWTWQLNSTEEMAANRLEAISFGKADFVITRKKKTLPFDQPADEMLQEMGYVECLQELGIDYRIFGRKKELH